MRASLPAAFRRPRPRLTCTLAILPILFCACREEPEPACTTRPQRARTDQSDEWQPAGGSRPGNEPAARPAGAEGATPPGSTPSQAEQTIPPDQAALLQPLADARVGEWAAYEMLDGYRQRWQVVAAEDGSVRIQVLVTRYGEPVGLPAIRTESRDFHWALADARRVKAAVSIRREPLRLRGKDLVAQHVIARWHDEGVAYVRDTWISNEVPVFGLARMTLSADGRLVARMELLASGP